MSDPQRRRIGPVEVGAIAHGGHCVARHDGRVIFVRHALPGEQVMVELTDTAHDRYWRGDAVEVRVASPERVAARCPISGPGGCGGCDLQHVGADFRREWKRRVVAEQLDRLAGIGWDGEVAAVGDDADDEDDRGWRTRMRYVRDADDRAWGLRAHRSRRVVALPEGGCGIAHPGLPGRPSVGQVVELTLSSTGQQVVRADDERVSGPGVVTERVGDLDFAVAADGFWQVHPAAAGTLTSAVLELLEPRPGETALDLYCGVGLFAGALAAAGVEVVGIEQNRAAIGHARQNVPAARFRAGRVERELARAPRSADLVVLDPPRQGAGRAVVAGVLARRPRAIAYVACDPAALARDLRTMVDRGWQPVEVRAFDLFPMTHHVECVALIVPPAAAG